MEKVAGNKAGLNLGLEAIRGFAALFVVINHLEALDQVFNKQYLPRPLIVFSPNGHLFVLVFFVLSGYVMAISHPGRMQGAAITSFVKKRLVRIYPIYLIAIIGALLIDANNYTIDVIAGNLLMMQMLLVPVIATNTPAWSLHYEVIYYALFIPIARYNWNGWWLFVISIVIAVIDVDPLSEYALGFSFWIGGFCIGRYLKEDVVPATKAQMIAMVLLLLALDQLLSRAGFVHSISKWANHPYWPAWMPESESLISSGKDLVFLPFYLFVMLVFSGRYWKHKRVVFWLLNILLVISIVLTLRKWILFNHTDHIRVYFISVAYYIVALLLWCNKWKLAEYLSTRIINAGIWLGAISYAIYIIHAPLLYIVGYINFCANIHLNYSIKFCAFVGLLILLSYMLEKRLQPWIRKQMLG